MTLRETRRLYCCHVQVKSVSQEYDMSVLGDRIQIVLVLTKVRNTMLTQCPPHLAPLRCFCTSLI